MILSQYVKDASGFRFFVERKTHREWEKCRTEPDKILKHNQSVIKSGLETSGLGLGTSCCPTFKCPLLSCATVKIFRMLQRSK
jgi:hypothetical protein